MDKTPRSVASVLLGGILVSVLAAGAALLAVALNGPWPVAVCVAGVTVLALPALVTVLRGRRARIRNARYRRPVMTSAVGLLVSLTWIWPHSATVTPPTVPGSTILTSADGTRLTLHVTRAPSATKPPLVVVHGGPGVSDLSHDVAALAGLATDRDVYVYDQLGSGSSSRLDDPLGYTDRRALDDLERVVAETRAPKVTLLGHSWGARIVTKYAVAHPDRLSAVILSAPGFPAGTSPGPQKIGDPGRRLDTAQRLRLYGYLMRPRNLFTYALSSIDLRVAHDTAGDREMDARFSDIYQRTTPGLFCDPHLADRLGVTGVGYYAHQALAADTSPLADGTVPARISAPTLIIKPACDYLPWSAVTENAGLAPRAQVVVLPDTGHQAYIEKPDAYAELVAAFLNHRPLPFPVVGAADPPTSYRGVR
ncbi:pimeloyl-ACP methyl ester carboxylesterase [Kribbella sp. VKM Ac-2571]|uniref:alpha/beta hydrolase n=1 Tax=Kribbella sp. VKM Ac-2571 TaxID=2512222 RepID=UPI00105FE1EE|nr:alpha/beta hydrolase [Kribbella sp. VKM Ac-2571]TDO68647.1 pimeloyl-ACP methyl ester carboxylesterase [Kribbella sp. VKM Ac-2571]